MWQKSKLVAHTIINRYMHAYTYTYIHTWVDAYIYTLIISSRKHRETPVGGQISVSLCEYRTHNLLIQIIAQTAINWHTHLRVAMGNCYIHTYVLVYVYCARAHARDFESKGVELSSFQEPSTYNQPYIHACMLCISYVQCCIYVVTQLIKSKQKHHSYEISSLVAPEVFILTTSGATIDPS